MTENKSIVMERIYEAPIEMVWKAITDRDQLKAWYFDFADDFILEVSSEFDWTAGPCEGKQWLHHGKILEIIEGKKLSHTWEYPGYAGSSTVIWELSAIDKDRTKLIFTHIFTIPFDPNEAALRTENFAEGWTEILMTKLPDFLQKMKAST